MYRHVKINQPTMSSVVTAFKRFDTKAIQRADSASTESSETRIIC